MTNLQFVGFKSTLDSGFWHVLSKKKLDEYGLSDDLVPLHGFYSNSNAHGLPCLFQVDFTSFNGEIQIQPGTFHLQGQLLNTNTIDQFKTCDKQQILRSAGNKIWNSIMAGDALKKPELLNSFVILTFANLKKYHYHYWFGFPALCSPSPILLVKAPVSVSEVLSPAQVAGFITDYDARFRHTNTPCFVLHLKTEGGVSLLNLCDDAVADIVLDELIFVYVDPSTLLQHPGWTLRNYLSLISRHFVKNKDSTVRILGLRDRRVNGRTEINHSIYLEVLLSPLSPNAEMWNVVGWEKNAQQKLLPRFVNMSKAMDPTHLAESAVDLNLKLMRWRLLPELDLGSISKTKCLLLGAGTLGCNVARNLLGWGVRTITLVDNATVSFSNPVRQSLFTFEHCQGGGLPKAETAAQSLKLIFPGVDAKGFSLAIPMPGHPVPLNAQESVQKDVATLEKLIEEHDALFLLMDTRESRWLPTVVGSAKNKIVMTAALGFDTWLAMRHGGYSESNDNKDSSDEIHSTSGNDLAESQAGAAGGEDNPYRTKIIAGDDLGCYYCNDVVAPRDSTKDRTLDQQCTVSRPGLSMLCSALIVELMISLIQHPLRSAAPAHIIHDEDDEAEQCILGILPHQIRGYLSRYQIILPVSRKFKNCTACSDVIVNRYKEDGFEFLLKAFNDAKYLEEISGLQELQVDPLGMEVLSDFDGDEDDW